MRQVREAAKEAWEEEGLNMSLTPWQSIHHRHLHFVQHLLKVGDPVWLIKEEKGATVNREFFDYHKSQNGNYEFGKIGLIVDGKSQEWFVSSTGKGLDHLPLLRLLKLSPLEELTQIQQPEPKEETPPKETSVWESI